MKRYFRKLSVAFSLTIIVLAISACGAKSPNIEISNAWVRPDPLWENAAGYFQITNSGTEPDALLGIEVLFAERGSLHESVMDGEIHKMIPVDRLEVGAGETAEFKPMSYHVMIGTLDQNMEYGDSVTFILEFETSGFIEVEAELRKE